MVEIAESETIQFEVFCPCCGIKLNGLVNGKKDTCPDCRASFSVRIFEKGAAV